MMTDTYGPTCALPLAIFDRASWSWKMFGGMFPSDSMPSLVIFPASGMTLNGELFERPMLVPATIEPDCSSLLPTRVADNSRGLAQPGTDYASLPNAVLSLLPTPKSRDWRDGVPSAAGRRRHSPPLIDLLPTPAVNDMGAGKTIEARDEWTATMQAKHGGNGHGPSLEIETLRLLSECTGQQSTVGLT